MEFDIEGMLDSFMPNRQLTEAQLRHYEWRREFFGEHQAWLYWLECARKAELFRFKATKGRECEILMWPSLSGKCYIATPNTFSDDPWRMMYFAKRVLQENYGLECRFGFPANKNEPTFVIPMFDKTDFDSKYKEVKKPWWKRIFEDGDEYSYCGP